MALVLLAVLPVLLFAGYTVYRLAAAQQRALSTELTQRAEAAANAVNQRLAIATGYLNALATSDAAIEDNLPALYEHARRIVAANPEARAFTLIAPDGRMIFITLRPFGTGGLVGSDWQALKKVFETGRPVVSSPFKSPISDAIVTTVAVPIFHKGKVAYCLRMVLLTESLNDLLASQKLPPAWTAAIVDANGLLVARSPDPQHFVGRKASPTLLAGLRAGTQGLFETKTLDGARVMTAVMPVPGWDWKIAVSVPAVQFREPLYESMLQIVLVGVVVTMAGLLAALRISRRITRQVRQVVKASRALEGGRHCAGIDST